MKKKKEEQPKKKILENKEKKKRMNKNATVIGIKKKNTYICRLTNNSNCDSAVQADNQTRPQKEGQKKKAESSANAFFFSSSNSLISETRRKPTSFFFVFFFSSKETKKHANVGSGKKKRGKTEKTISTRQAQKTARVAQKLGKKKKNSCYLWI